MIHGTHSFTCFFSRQTKENLHKNKPIPFLVCDRNIVQLTKISKRKRLYQKWSHSNKNDVILFFLICFFAKTKVIWIQCGWPFCLSFHFMSFNYIVLIKPNKWCSNNNLWSEVGPKHFSRLIVWSNQQCTGCI